MIKSLYAIRDCKSGFLSPMIDDTDDSALRNFEYACKNNNIMNFAPQDFELYKIGSYDTDSGILSPIEPTEFIANGINFRKVEE